MRTSHARSHNIFFWFENIPFREDVMGAGTPHVAVSLAVRDQVVDACAVWGYLTEGKETGSGSLGRCTDGGLEVLYIPELDHATVFDLRANRAELLEALARFVQSSGASQTE
jgi:hypothetical protein